MSRVIVFAGTIEGRLISEWLAGGGVETICSVATEYGRTLVNPGPLLDVRQGRLSTEEMASLFAENGLPLVLDVTHPYAAAVSDNISAACAKAGCEYLRLIRPEVSVDTAGGNVIFVSSVEEAAEWLSDKEGSILATTGSKELYKYTVIPDFRERVYARVLSNPEVVKDCAALGFTGQHLICMQGPFSKEMNTAMLRQIKAKYLVTKESGKAGGFADKIEAAAEAGATVVLVGRPPEHEGVSILEGIELLKKRFCIETDPPGFEEDASREETGNNMTRKAYLVGIGMGVPENMTAEAAAAFKEADAILGSGRMLDPFRNTGKPLFDAYDPAKMAAYVREHPEYRTFAVSLSGDVGFYSGAKRLIKTFEAEGLEVELITGISSVTYFCSRLKIPWEDVKLISIHGRKGNIVAAVRENFHTFTLLGGRDNVGALCRTLLDYGFENVTVHIGERLHYPDERITAGSPGELIDGDFDGLCVAVIENPDFHNGTVSCIPDDEFIRGKAPMTKSEVRSLSVSKLRLTRDAVAWDIGAGTGSCTVEMALQVPDGQIYAIEKKDEAADLIGENCRKFKTPNVQVIRGSAPSVLEDLPAPTHAFIGGSSGSMKEILELLLEKNPHVRVVINAITLETVAETNACLKKLPFEDIDITQIQAAGARKVGPYNMMMGQNPVYIFAATGNGGEEG